MNEMRRKVAESLGWKRTHGIMQEPDEEPQCWLRPDGITTHKLPELTLDWMHEVEKTLNREGFEECEWAEF